MFQFGNFLDGIQTNQQTLAIDIVDSGSLRAQGGYDHEDGLVTASTVDNFDSGQSNGSNPELSEFNFEIPIEHDEAAENGHFEVTNYLDNSSIIPQRTQSDDMADSIAEDFSIQNNTDSATDTVDQIDSGPRVMPNPNEMIEFQVITNTESAEITETHSHVTFLLSYIRFASSLSNIFSFQFVLITFRYR